MSRLALCAAVMLAANAFAANPPSQPALKEWTFLVYMNADNNLDANGVEDMNEMEKVGSSDQVNIVTQLDREGDGGTWRYLVQKDTDTANITSPILETMPEQDMGSPDTLKAFIEWGIAKFPAKKVAVVIWNHGSGWEKRNPRFGTRGVSYDDQSGNHLSVKDVGGVLHAIASKRGQKFEIIGYDACLMQMAEVADEATGAVNYQVASEETEPLDGWPYDDFFAQLVAHPEWNGADAGKALVEAYKASYLPGGSAGESDTTQSVVDLNAFADFKAAADKFAASLSANPAYKEKVAEAVRASQSYAESDHKDFVDFIDQITERITDQPVVDAAAALKTQLGTKVILGNGSTGDALAKSSGLAVWVPTYSSESLMSNYKNLNWAATTQWDEFVNQVTTAGGNFGGDGGDGGDGFIARALHRTLLFGQHSAH